eukprot:4832453-Amphidinium_carterae.1
MPTQKKPKKKAKQVCFNADALAHNAETPHANETRKECFDLKVPAYANATLLNYRSAQLAFLPLGLANKLSAENHSARKRLARFAILWGCVPKGFFRNKSCKLFTHGIHPTGILLTGRWQQCAGLNRRPQCISERSH